MHSAVRKPFQPPAKKPPCSVRLLKPMECPPLPKPKKMTPSPTTIMTIMVVTLIMANQNSISPYRRTAARFASATSPTAISAGIHCAISGNQNWT
ncbi:Uncharacterised protein [Klebsiella oxytoca]|nr:Uncharacterised protein [Klebsiella oxytoca]